MIKIGITGGIGSGKSEVLKYIDSTYKAKIFEADKVAHGLLDTEAVIRDLSNIFGNNIIKNGVVDRTALGELCFNNSYNLDRLNSIIHPAVKKIFDNEVRKAGEAFVDVFVIEAALLIECGYKPLLDSLWYISSDTKIRIKRLMKNRGYSRQKCVSIISSQVNDEVYESNCDIIIDNSNELDDMYLQVDRIMTEFKIRKIK